MTEKKKNETTMSDREYMERLTLCAELGQIVPLDRARLRQHYEGLVAEASADALADRSATSPVEYRA